MGSRNQTWVSCTQSVLLIVLTNTPALKFYFSTQENKLDQGLANSFCKDPGFAPSL